MAIEIRMQGNFADEELRSFYEWLLDEVEIRQMADIRLTAKEPTSGEMGTALDAITLVTTSVIGLPGMIDVLRNWRQTRRRKPEITVERGELKVTFRDIDSEAAIEVLKKIVSENDAS